MFFHRCQDAKVALDPAVVIVEDVVLDHPDKGLSAGKAFPVVAFPFQDAPESLYRAIIDTVGHARHALYHPGLFQLVVEDPIRILESSVTVEEGMGIGIDFNRAVKGFIDQRIIVVITDHMRHDTSVVKVKDSAEVDLVYGESLIPFEFRYICKPFLVGSICMEFPVQKILCQILRFFCSSGAAVAAVFDGRFYIFYPTNSLYPFVVDTHTAVMPQIVRQTPVAFIRTFGMQSLYFFGQSFILKLSVTLVPGCPLVIRRTRNIEQCTGRLKGIPLPGMADSTDSCVLIGLPYFRQTSPLSSSSNFFSRSRSISARYNLCFNRSISICACSSSVLGV